MGSHFGAIGLGGGDFGEVVHRLMEASRLIGRDDSRDRSVYAHEDASGARATITLEGARVACVTPSFRPGTILDVEPGSLAGSDCPYERPFLGQRFDGDDELYPMAVQIDDLALGEKRLLGASRLRIEVAALAETIDVFADESAFRATGSPMAVQSLIPSGLFAPPAAPAGESFRVSPRILMTGVVTSGEERTHSLFGEPFVRLSVSSYGGEFEALVAPGDLTDDAGEIRVPRPGSIVSGRFWLSGRAVAEAG